MEANVLFEGLEMVFNVGDGAAEVGKLMYVSMGECSKSSVRLTFSYFGEQRQLFIPFGDLFGDKLIDE